MKVLHVISNRVGPGCPDGKLDIKTGDLRLPALANRQRLTSRLPQIEMKADRGGRHVNTVSL